MLDSETTKAVCARLNNIARQIEAIERMVEAGVNIAPLMHALDDAQLTLGKVGELAFRAHVNNSVGAAIRDGDGRVNTRRVGPFVVGLGRDTQQRRVGEPS